MTDQGWIAGAIRQGVAPSQAPLGRLMLRAALSLAAMAGLIWLLADRWAQIDTKALTTAFAGLGLGQWGIALALTALSFWAVGRYDTVIHRHFLSTYPDKIARRAGICAIAVSQTLGLGLISGAILRWRLLPNSSLWQATRLTAAVALTFLAGWAVVTSLVLLALPAAPFRGWAALGLQLALVLTGLCLVAPRRSWWRFRWPNGFTLARLLGLCAVDTLAAAGAFYVLLPPGQELAFQTLLPAFLLALGAGLALGTPGGMGAFEVTLLALLPAAQETDLLTAVLAWRLVYYALPAVLGAGFALRGPGPCILPPRLAPRLPALPRAEAGLCHQGNLKVSLIAGQAWLTGRRGHTLIGVLDPMGRRDRVNLDHALRGLHRIARNEGRLPVAYKISARLAARARRMGLTVRRIGSEAWVTPQTFCLTSPSRAGLRRKLRRAETAGVLVVACDPATAPWADLDRIAADWADHHQGERGFSMGQYDQTYLRHQRLYIAVLDGVPIAFISLHSAAKEWALDLMRHTKTMPDGTMHSLIVTAIRDAATAGINRLSLAAAPEAAFHQSRGDVDPAGSARLAGQKIPDQHDLVCRLMATFAPQTSAKGLYRFKASFAPRWTPLYLAVPGRTGLVIAGLSLWRAICRPPPLSRHGHPSHSLSSVREYGFTSAATSWHIEPNSP